MIRRTVRTLVPLLTLALLLLIAFAAACGADGEPAPQLEAAEFSLADVSDPGPRANGDLMLAWTVPRDNPIVLAVDVRLPPNWVVATAAELTPGQTIGSGVLLLDSNCDQASPLFDEFLFVVKAAASAEGPTLWVGDLENGPPLVFTVEGDPQRGQTVRVDLVGPQGTPHGCPPLFLELNLMGRSAAGDPILTNPPQEGWHTFTASFYTQLPGEPAEVREDRFYIGELE